MVSAMNSTFSAAGNPTAGAISNWIYTWGDNSVGQLGIENPGAGRVGSASSPVLLGSGGAQYFIGSALITSLFKSPTLVGTHPGSYIGYQALSATQITSGGTYFTIINYDGTLATVGPQAYGQGAGDSDINNYAEFKNLNPTVGLVFNRSSPVQIGTLSSWSQVSTGTSHTLALRTDGTLWGWGRATVGQLANFGAQDEYATGNHAYLAPGQIARAYTWTKIAAGLIDSGYAIRSDGGLFAWGLNTGGQVGTSDTFNRSSPVQLTSGSWSQITAGTSFTLAIRSTDYSLWSWGLNGGGQLGINDTFNRSSPIQIGTSSWTQVSAGQSHVSGTKLDKTIWSWGSNVYGQLAVTDRINRSSPTQISTTSWLGSISSSGFNFIQYDVFGTLITGRNDAAQLGLVASDTIHRSSPVLVPSVSYPTAAYAIVSPTRLVAFSWLQLSAGNTYSMGILTDSTLWGWGVNSLGQLGINNNIIRSSPVQVGTSSWSQVNAGPYQHTIGIKLDNTLWSWGLNSSGQLGLNNTINRSSPVQIGTNLWVSAIPGFSHTVGLNSLNIAYAWGLNSLGQLGLNDTSNRSSPVQLATTFIDSQVAAGGNNSSVLDRYGVLYNWGDNSYGQLGDG